MKNLLLLMLLGFTLNSVWAQGNASNNNYDINLSVKEDSEPFFPAGEMKMYEHVFYNLDYSEEAKNAKVSGELLLSFYVNADSTLSNFKVVKSVGYGIDEGVIKLMKQLKFAPGRRNGEPVRKNLLLSFPIEVE